MRETCEGDVPFILELFALPHASRYLNDPGRDGLLGTLEDPEVDAFLIEDDSEPEGYFQLRDRGWLVGFEVLIVARSGRGTGTFALRWALDQVFRERQAHRVLLEIREDNDRIRALAEHLGFKQEGLMRDGFYHVAAGTYRNICPYARLRTDP